MMMQSHAPSYLLFHLCALYNYIFIFSLRSLIKKKEVWLLRRPFWTLLHAPPSHHGQRRLFSLSAHSCVQRRGTYGSEFPISVQKIAGHRISSKVSSLLFSFKSFVQHGGKSFFLLLLRLNDAIKMPEIWRDPSDSYDDDDGTKTAATARHIIPPAMILYCATFILSSFFFSPIITLLKWTTPFFS